MDDFFKISILFLLIVTIALMFNTGYIVLGVCMSVLTIIKTIDFFKGW